MSDDDVTAEDEAPVRPPSAARPRWRRPVRRDGHAGREEQELRNLGQAPDRPTAGPNASGCCSCVLLGVISVLLSVTGPKVLGMATDLIFEGAISLSLPAGVTQEQVIAQLEASGDTQQADLLRNLDLHPGEGIDFAALQMVLGFVLLLYVFSSVFQYVQGLVLNGITQRTVYRLRSDVEEKIHRLPLSLLRQDAARRAAEPRHERHRQRLAEPAADAEPDAHLDPDRHRRRRDDVHHLAAARPDRPGRHPAHPRHHGRDREAFAEAVRGAVGAHRSSQRPDRGGLLAVTPS